jgi:hypothetical protein
MEQKTSSEIETWAIVEVMGHSKYAGFVRQVALGGAAMIRVDVPEIPEREQEYSTYEWDEKDQENKRVKKTRTLSGLPAYTKFLGVSAIFAITPCTEEFARAAVERFRSEPASAVDLPTMRALPSPSDEDDNDQDNGE